LINLGLHNFLRDRERSLAKGQNYTLQEIGAQAKCHSSQEPLTPPMQSSPLKHQQQFFNLVTKVHELTAFISLNLDLFSGIAREITLLKQENNALRQENARLKVIFSLGEATGLNYRIGLRPNGMQFDEKPTIVL